MAEQQSLDLLLITGVTVFITAPIVVGVLNLFGMAALGIIIIGTPLSLLLGTVIAFLVRIGETK